MLRAYLDASVHSQIAAGQVPAEEVAALWTALVSGAIAAPLSIVDIYPATGLSELGALKRLCWLLTPRLVSVTTCGSAKCHDLRVSMIVEN